MKVGFLQTLPKYLKPRENLASALESLEREHAAGRGAELWVLPELFASGYNFKSRRDADLASETVPGPSSLALRDFCRMRGCAVVAGLAERSGGGLYNSAVFVTPGGIELYRKLHLFGREKLFFKPGDLGLKVFAWKGAKIGVMVCFDWLFPEAMRTLALKGAQVVAHPANLVLPWCPEAMKVRCLENRVFAVTADRVGAERGLRFIGRSQIAGPDGRVLVRAGTRPAAAVRDVDLRLALDKRVTPANDLFKDRRGAFYAR